MEFKSISDIYAVNDRVFAKLKATVEPLTDEQATAHPEDEKWSVQEFVEHIAIVNDGVLAIATRLLTAAKEAGKTSGGAVVFSDGLKEKMEAATNVKIEAPDRVRPTGTVSIADSLARMAATREKYEELKPMFESHSSPEFTFPHPAFGPMSATEWLVLAGGHINRHIAHIGRVLGKI